MPSCHDWLDGAPRPSPTSDNPRPHPPERPRFFSRYNHRPSAHSPLLQKAIIADPDATPPAPPEPRRPSLRPRSRSSPSSSYSRARRATIQPTMSSKVPLLMRSSPAQGTGSYGAMPVHLMSTSNSSSDNDDTPNIDQVLRSGKRKPKSKLAAAESSPEDGASTAAQRSASTGNMLGNGTQRSRRISLPAVDLPDRHTSAVDAWVGSLDGDLDSSDDQRGYAPGASKASPKSESTSDSTRSDSSEVIDVDGPEDDQQLLRGKSNEESPPDDSPYAQVRASVRPFDDTSLSINTPRMWTLSLLFSFLGSATNLFFSLRYPSVSITPVIALLLVHPLGRLWDGVFKRPDDPIEVFSNGSIFRRVEEESNERFANGDSQPNGSAQRVASSGRSNSWRRGLRLWLGQGRWNEKEHCCVYISSNVSFGFAFATDVIVEQSQFYGQRLGITYQILLTISTQVLGYALAGITRRFLVRPSGMIWPGTLISTSMFSTLHKQDNKPANGWYISRMRFFLYVFLGSAAFYFLPGLLFPALSYFSVVTWFAPKNVVVANLFGIASGLGMFPLTFDWAQISYIGSPLVVPFWASLNIIGGLLVVMWIIAPIMYYCNVLYSSYMPILSTAVFDNTGRPYDVSKILTDKFLFDEDAYKNYSRVFLPITYVLSYALQFAALTALLSHTACWHGKDILQQWKASWKEIKGQSDNQYRPIPQEERPLRHARSTRSMTASMPDLDNMMGVEDVHNRLMRRYKDAPMSWYLATGALMAAIGMFVVEYYPIHLPWYGLLLALGICTILFIPIGIVMAITNQQSSLYLICQLICGAVFPGRPVANMVFVTYGYITSTQGLKFSSDLKLGHYMKIPPRLLFMLQLVATLVSSLTQIGVLNWMLANIPGICTPNALNGFTCPIARVHFNGSILWGVVGPARFFGHDALYRPLVWAFLIGAIAPIGVFILGRHQKRSIWRKVNLPVLFGSLSWIPPATGLNFSVWALVCWLFNDVIRKRKTAWWKKYNMTLSAALDSGVAVGVVVVFFGVIYPGWIDGFSWWGTEVYKQGCDWVACSFRNVAPGEHFGPGTW
ncbi:OPT oligopeptide transporter protein-domain-containing protein [Phyllosticta capitalensis]